MLPRIALRPWASAFTKPIAQTSTRTLPPSLPQRPLDNLRLFKLPIRQFSATPSAQSWLMPRRGHSGKSRKGRPRVRTGGSTSGTAMQWGDYGLRMCDHHRRVSSKQLEIGWNTIRQRLRGLKYRLVPRVAADRAVFVSGNEQRMGKGKGAFDHFASRIAVNHMIFELRGDVHEKVVRDAFRLAAAKMPGKYEFVKKGDPPVMGLTKVLPGMTLDTISRPWLYNSADDPTADPVPQTAPAESRVPPAPKQPLEARADRLPSASP